VSYESYATLEELLTDEGATEFRAKVLDIPANMPSEGLFDWAEREAPSSWGHKYEPALTAFVRLVSAEPDYDLAMAQVRSLQGTIAAAGPVSEPAGRDEPGERAEPVPEPADAVTEVTLAITIPAIDLLKDQYPDAVTRFSPEQLAAAAVEVTIEVLAGARR
jgi:hypothetical protein